jgi:hypothetical protein
MPKEPTESPDMERFNAALRQVLKATKDDLKRLLASDEAKASVKQKRGPKPKRAPEHNPPA